MPGHNAHVHMIIVLHMYVAMYVMQGYCYSKIGGYGTSEAEFYGE